MPAVAVLKGKVGEFFVYPKFAGGMNEALAACSKTYQRFREVPKNPEDDLKVLEILSQLCRENNCSLGISVSENKMEFIEGVKKAFGALVIPEDGELRLSEFKTVSEALEKAKQIRSEGKALIISDTGETLDSFSADFAVGCDSVLFKGSLERKEGIAKFNRLLDIALEVGEKVKWAELP